MRHVSWNEALALFAAAQLAAGRSAGTVRLYRHYLRQLADSCSGLPANINTRQIEAVLAVPRWSPETRKSARGAIRAFYRWAAAAGIVEDDPAAQLEPVKVPAGVPRPAPDAVLERAIAGAPARERLMLQLAGYAGLRACEIARLHSDDVVEAQLYVTGKGGRSRLVPLLGDLEAQLRSLPGGYAFPNGLGSHVSAGHASRLMSAALPAGWTAHTLRHRFATRAYAGTRDLLAVQALLGHSQPETTRRYVQLPTDALRAAVEAAA